MEKGARLAVEKQQGMQKGKTPWEEPEVGKGRTPEFDPGTLQGTEKTDYLYIDSEQA